MRFHSEAIKDLSKAVSLSPAHGAVALFNRGLCHSKLGNTVKVSCV